MKTIEEIIEGQYDSRILPFLWMHGENAEVIRNYMNKIYDSNIREVCIESRPHPDFMGEKWFRDLDIIIEEAEKLGMSIWILDDAHFPTGSANGLVEKYPERRKKILKHRVIQVLGPKNKAQIQTFLPGDSSAEVYKVVAKNDVECIVLESPDGDGKITFDLEKGYWDIYIMYISNQSNYNDNYINMVDKKSCSTLIEAVYEPHYQRYSKYFGTVIKGFFSDEPGFMNEKGMKNDSLIGKVMPLPWSEEVENKLKDKLGNNYVTFLPELWGKKNKKNAKIRFVYMDIVTELFKQNFSQQLGEWCHEHNVSYIGHIIEDRDSHARLGVGAGHYFRALDGQHMSGIDIVLNQLIPGMDYEHETIRGSWDGEFFHYALARLGSSLGHIDPKKEDRTVAEIFGAYGWHEGLTLMKWICDHFVVRGVNHFVPHAFTMKDFPDADCPPHFYAHGKNPQFPYFKILMKYLNQLSTIFSDGKSMPDAALLYHAEAEWTGSFLDSQKPAKILTQNQFDFDFIPSDIFTYPEKYKASFSKGLVINELHYPLFILPYSEYVSRNLADKLLQIDQTKTKVVIIDDLPLDFYDTEKDENLLKELDRFDVVALDKIEACLLEYDKRSIKVAEKEHNLRFYKYKKAQQMYLMVFNENPIKKIKTKITVDYSGTIYKLDLISNKKYIVNKKNNEIDLELSPYESFVFVFGDLDPKVEWDVERVYSKEFIFNGEIDVSYSDAINYPKFGIQVRIPEFSNLSILEEFKNKSGHFKYSIEFDLTEKEQKKYALLDLGVMNETAKVSINGNFCGTRICQPYHFEVNDVFVVGKNILEVEVTNTLVHTMIDYLSLSEIIEPTGLQEQPKLYFEN